MPAFASLGEPAIAALIDFLLDKGDKEVVVERAEASGGTEVHDGRI